MTTPNNDVAAQVIAALQNSNVLSQAQMPGSDDILKLAQDNAKLQQQLEQLRAQLEEGKGASQTASDLKLLSENGDEDAYRRLCAAAGIPGHYVEEALQVITQEFDDDSDDGEEEWEDDEDDEPVATTPQQDDGPIDYGRLSPELQDLIAEVGRGRLDKVIGNVLDTDEKIGYYMGRAPEGRQNFVRQFLADELKTNLRMTNRSLTDIKDAVRDVVPKVHKLIEAFPVEQPQIGLGAAPGDASLMPVPDQKPEHVPLTASATDVEDNITAALAYEMSKGN